MQLIIITQVIVLLLVEQSMEVKIMKIDDMLANKKNVGKEKENERRKRRTDGLMDQGHKGGKKRYTNVKKGKRQ